MENNIDITETSNNKGINKNMNRRANGLCPCDCPNCDSDNCIESDEWASLNDNGRRVKQKRNIIINCFGLVGLGLGNRRNRINRDNNILKSTSINEIKHILEEFNNIKEKCPSARMVEIRKIDLNTNGEVFTLIYTVNKKEFNSIK